MSPQTLLLRPARAADAPAAVRLLESEKLEAAFAPAEFVVAEDEAGRLVGTARLKPLGDGGYELASVAVDASLRGRGVGERLVRAALDRAAGAEVWALALAPGFFAKLGFAPLESGVLPAVLQEKAEGVCASTGMVPMRLDDAERVRAEVRARYGAVARAPLLATSSGACCAPAGEAASCCGPSADSPDADYTPEELASVPPESHLSVGSGNPVRRAELREGERVVDLGSGGGVDVFLAARRVGPTGRAIGVDMTPEMLARARRAAAAHGVANVEFREGRLEALPVESGWADVVVSNCVINLSPEKDKVLAEAYRVLRPGGRFVVSDTLKRDASCAVDADWCGCVSGALTPEEYEKELRAAGFDAVEIREAEFREDGTGRGYVVAVKPAP